MLTRIPTLIKSYFFHSLSCVLCVCHRENIHEESERLKQALDVIGADMHTIFGLLTNPASTDSGGRMSYFQVILKLLEIADHSPSLVDFYWPQVRLPLLSLAIPSLLPIPSPVFVVLYSTLALFDCTDTFLPFSLSCLLFSPVSSSYTFIYARVPNELLLPS